jgi:hypothetical protein
MIVFVPNRPMIFFQTVFSAREAAKLFTSHRASVLPAIVRARGDRTERDGDRVWGQNWLRAPLAWKGLMSQMGQSLPKWAFRETSAFPPDSDRTADIPDWQLRAQKQTTQRLLSVDGGSSADIFSIGQLNRCDTVFAPGRHVPPGLGRTSS